MVQDAGFSPNLVIIGSSDAVALDLLRAVPTGNYLLDPLPRQNGATPLSGMQVVVGVGSGAVVLDTSAVQCLDRPAHVRCDTVTVFSTTVAGPPRSPGLAWSSADGVYVVAAGTPRSPFPSEEAAAVGPAGTHAARLHGTVAAPGGRTGY